ncbi:MAG: hypothetical protein IJ544_00150, partial [Prevotella sp.]|nr:hypothetical protein [Prevotella sp.]
PHLNNPLRQSYEKLRTKQKNLFFFLPRRSKFALTERKVTKKRVKCKRKTCSRGVVKRPKVKHESALAEVKASGPIRTSLYEREGSIGPLEATFTEAPHKSTTVMDHSDIRVLV